VLNLKRARGKRIFSTWSPSRTSWPRTCRRVMDRLGLVGDVLHKLNPACLWRQRGASGDGQYRDSRRHGRQVQR